MMKPTVILFLPGTGLSEDFYSPLLKSLEKHGSVTKWRYRHKESMVEACRRLGGSADFFKALRSEVCFGPSNTQVSLLGLKPSDGISAWHETSNDLQTESAESLWRRTVVVGHSQGAGHALMISKKQSLAGVLMIAGPADCSHGELAPWTKEEFQTPTHKRLLMVHTQDASHRAVTAHAEVIGLRRWELHDEQPREIGGLALVDTERVPALTAHGCLAGAQTWADGTKRQPLFAELLSRAFEQWHEED